MITWAMKKIFGTSHERAIRRMKPRVEAINRLEDSLKKLSDAELRAKTAEFKEQLDNGKKLDDILVPAFAVCREASRRALKMRHYDVQLIGGMVLHDGCIAEMRTGEGKTLVATLACYLNALEGKGVHVVTVNDYLAKRDAEWMGKLYGFLGLTTGTVVNQQGDEEKKAAYRCDITYGQNNEFGFDYLRDNMKFSALDYAQRPLHYAIVDEVDSILIDEARTPLIISGQGERSSDKYKVINEIIPRLRNEEHYTLDEKAHSVTLTDEGTEVAERLLTGLQVRVGESRNQPQAGGMEAVLKSKNLYDPVNLETLHILNQCLRAHSLYKRDVNYLVREGKVMIVDEFTGRVLVGRRWSDGLHQAVEAKENVRIQEENRTMATITFQNLFRIYKKLSGMTGTADTEAAEFHSTYKLEVVMIPTNKPVVRVDYEDLVYKTEKEKFTAVIDEIIRHHELGQPILVGTTSVEKSTAISTILRKRKIQHHVLNAKHHENEAFVVAQAGRKGSITVSTNMAGRGTDIVLGGNPEMLAKLKFKEQNRIPEAEAEAFDELVAELTASCKAEGDEIRVLKDADGVPIMPGMSWEKENGEVRVVRDEDGNFLLRDAEGKLVPHAEDKPFDTKPLGGLYIVGTERHESRRIDNQLRGRSGRQGDPGMSKFYLSLEDDLMRIFAGDRVKNLMERMGMPDDEPIEHPWVTKSVENAQKKVEERNFDIRKNLLEYDDVMSAQRKTIYDMRQAMLIGRYEPDVLDEEGKPTGEKRAIKPMASLEETVTPEVGALLGMFLDDPIMPRDKEGKPRKITRKLFEKAKESKFVEIETLQREIYTKWGVKLDLEGREDEALEVYDELAALVPLALTEQRERLLDLLDRILGAMVEESCPPRKPPEDWDWGGIFQGFRDHFGAELPDDIAEIHDPEQLAQDLYKRAEKAYEKREEEIGVELALRIFRHIYLEEVDAAWVEHLTAMDHLRDSIGLRGYGQKDPKQEYKKEGYNLFLDMIARVSSNVVTKLFAVNVRSPEQDDAREMEEIARHEELAAHSVGRHDEDPVPEDVLPPEEAPPAHALNTEMECPCGSGKPFSQCHGGEDEATA